MNNFEHRVLRIEPINTAVQRCASRSTGKPGRDVKIVSDRMLPIKGSAEHPVVQTFTLS